MGFNYGNYLLKGFNRRLKVVKNNRRGKKYGSQGNKHTGRVKKEPIILGDYVFPIYGMRTIDQKIQPYEIHGTCFSIGQDYFLTANHVVQYAKKSEQSRLGFLSQVTHGCVSFHNYTVIEEFPEADIALIQSSEIWEPEKKPKSFKWGNSPLFIFEDIRSMGFPHGFDVFRGLTSGRGFSGNVLAETFYELGELKANCYELSFQAPRGLSGGVLLDKHYLVHGLIIGNSKKEMYVFEEKTTKQTVNGNVEELIIVNETTFIGLAVTEHHIFRMKSKYFDMTFHEYLVEAKLH